MSDCYGHGHFCGCSSEDCRKNGCAAARDCPSCHPILRAATELVHSSYIADTTTEIIRLKADRDRLAAELAQAHERIKSGIQLVQKLRKFGNDNVHKFDVRPWLDAASRMLEEPRK